MVTKGDKVKIPSQETVYTVVRTAGITNRFAMVNNPYKPMGRLAAVLGDRVIWMGANGYYFVRDLGTLVFLTNGTDQIVLHLLDIGDQADAN